MWVYYLLRKRNTVIAHSSFSSSFLCVFRIWHSTQTNGQKINLGIRSSQLTVVICSANKENTLDWIRPTKTTQGFMQTKASIFHKINEVRKTMRLNKLQGIFGAQLLKQQKKYSNEGINKLMSYLDIVICFTGKTNEMLFEHPCFVVLAPSLYDGNQGIDFFPFQVHCTLGNFSPFQSLST